MSNELNERAVQIGQRLVADGFTKVPGDAAVYHLRKFMMSRFGLVDTVVSMRVYASPMTGTQFEAHEQETVDAALGMKTKIPRGFGSAVETFAISMAEQADESAVAAANAGLKNRWSVMSMPALIHGPQQQAVYFQGSKMWGAAYVKSLRKRVVAWLG